MATMNVTFTDEMLEKIIKKVKQELVNNIKVEITVKNEDGMDLDKVVEGLTKAVEDSFKSLVM